MSKHTTKNTVFTPANIVWGILLAFALFSILFPIYIMFKYSVADKDSFVTGGKYAAPLWPFNPNLDQYRELIGGECFKLTDDSLAELGKQGLPDEMVGKLKALKGESCSLKSEFQIGIDMQMKAGFKMTDDTLQALEKAGMPSKSLEILTSLLTEPATTEKKYLKAVEKQSSFQLTERSFEKLAKKDVDESLLTSLKQLEGKEMLSKEAYLSAVAENIGEDATQQHQKNLLKYGEYEELGSALLVQFKEPLVQHGFVGWQLGEIGTEESERYNAMILEEASAGFSIGRKDFLIAGGYSLQIAIFTVILALLIGAPAAFTLARYRFPGLAVLMFCIVSIRLFPDICSVIPVAEAFSTPPLSLIPPFFQVAMMHTLLSLPYVIYICMGVFKTIPKDLEEQAYILGASKFYAFRHVVIPVALSGMAAAAIYVFLLSWNEFIFSYYLLFKSPNVSLPVYLMRILAWTPQPNFLAAISAVLSVPVIIFSFAVQRYMISGMTAGAVK